MLKKKAKKGFTIVELVIVIAVIAILAAVLIPTFTNVVNKANESGALQKAKNAYTEFLSEAVGDAEDYSAATIQSGDYYFKVENGSLKETATKDTYSSNITLAASMGDNSYSEYVYVVEEYSDVQIFVSYKLKKLSSQSTISLYGAVATTTGSGS